MTTLLSKHDVNVWLICAAAVFGGVSFILELVGTEMQGDEDEYQEIGKLENESPIVRANIYSRWSFGWMTPLMKVCIRVSFDCGSTLMAIIAGLVQISHGGRHVHAPTCR